MTVINENGSDRDDGGSGNLFIDEMKSLTIDRVQWIISESL